MSIVKVSILVFLLSSLFVGSVYDYGMYHTGLKGEYSTFLTEREAKITAYALEHDECVKEWKSNHTGEPTDYWLWGPLPVRYTINNVDVVGRVMDDEYRCSIWKIPTVSFEEWKELAEKSYWNDLTKRLGGLVKRLRVVAVSAYGEPADINQSFEDYLKWIEEYEKSRDTPILLTLDDMWAMAQSKSTYKEEVNGTTYYYIRLTREQMEYIKTHPEDFNVSWYYATLPLEEPKITSVTNTTEDDLVYNVDGGVGIELSYPFYRGKYVGNNAQIDRESDEEFTGEVEEEYPTILEVNITTPDAPKITELGEDWEDVNESIFEMYPIHNPPTIYVMQTHSGWEYHTFKLPIYRRI
jgi:hypothetical protein